MEFCVSKWLGLIFGRAYYRKGFAFENWGLIFGGAYRNFTVYPLVLTKKMAISRNKNEWRRAHA